MAACLILITALLMTMAQLSGGCYQECSTIFNQKIQQLVGVRDTALLTQRSCQAMAEQMQCLEGRRGQCDPTSLQYVTTILSFIRPDYHRTCSHKPSNSSSNSGNSSDSQGVTSGQQLLTQCSQKANRCYVSFNDTYSPATLAPTQNMTAVCQAVDSYTGCLEELMPQCEPFMGRAVTSVRLMQQQYSFACSAGLSAQSLQECMNNTTQCYTAFNATFLPAVNQYNMKDMCRSMDNYSACLHALHQRTECQRFTQQALGGLNSLRRQYSMYCGKDGGQQAQQCVGRFQQCYTSFNMTYFPAVHSGNIQEICSVAVTTPWHSADQLPWAGHSRVIVHCSNKPRSVQQYWRCVQPMSQQCGSHMTQALRSVRVLKEQFAVQCNPEFQKLSSCRPLMTCLNHFAAAYPQRAPSATSTTTTTSLCTSLSSYFPCVERSLAQCKIPADHSSVPFSQLGQLTAAYCQHLLGNRVLNTCGEFLRCTSGIVLVSTPDPSAMFDAATWCSYMDMSLSCVERGINTPACGLANDDTIRGHLTQQRAMKRTVCKMASVPALTTPSPNAIPVDTYSETSLKQSPEKEGRKAGQDGSGVAGHHGCEVAMVTAAVMATLLLL